MDWDVDWRTIFSASASARSVDGHTDHLAFRLLQSRLQPVWGVYWDANRASSSIAMVATVLLVQIVPTSPWLWRSCLTRVVAVVILVVPSSLPAPAPAPARIGAASAPALVSAPAAAS